MTSRVGNNYYESTVLLKPPRVQTHSRSQTYTPTAVVAAASTAMAHSFAMSTLCTAAATSALLYGRRSGDDYTGLCHPGTREEYLEELKEWANDGPSEERVRWVNGQAGAGKTAMLRSFCDWLRNHPSAFFFIWKTDTERNTLNKLPATIAYQLLQKIPALDDHVRKALTEEPLLLQFAFEEQMQRLIVTPLLDAAHAVAKERHIIIVVDGLDELDPQGQYQFLKFIPTFISKLSSLPISLLVSSRPETQITGAFRVLALASITKPIRLGASDADIAKYLDDKFADINCRFPYLQLLYRIWPSAEMRRMMLVQSSGLFIWPTVALEYIDRVGESKRHNERLETVFSSSTAGLWTDSPLDKLYKSILNAHAPKDRTSVEFLRFKRRLALLCLPVRLAGYVVDHDGGPVDYSPPAIRVIFEETLEDIQDSVTDLAPVFALGSCRLISAGISPLPKPSHRSFRDFIFSRQRCGDDFYYRSEQELRTEIVCKLISFFSMAEAYDEKEHILCGQFIYRTKAVLDSYTVDFGVESYEDLGVCMDGINFDLIPTTWPLVFQAFMITCIFNSLWVFALRPEFPKGSYHFAVMTSKVFLFLGSRIASAKLPDAYMVYRLLDSAPHPRTCFHTVQCWHVDRPSPCTCAVDSRDCAPINIIQTVLEEAYISTPLRVHSAAQGIDPTPYEVLDMLWFILSKDFAASRLLIPVDLDTWIVPFGLLKSCAPDENLYNHLARMYYAAPLPLPPPTNDDYGYAFGSFIDQTKAFREYTDRCKRAGIDTDKFPPIDIPNEYLRCAYTRRLLLELKAAQPMPLALNSDFHWDMDANFCMYNERIKEVWLNETLESGSGTATVLFSEALIFDAASEPLGVHDAQEQGRSGELDLGQGVDQREVEAPSRIVKAEHGLRRIRRLVMRRR